MAKWMYNLCDAKTTLSQLVDRAAAGEEIIIAKAGKPRAKLVPARSTATPRQPGGWASSFGTRRQAGAAVWLS
ncbi:MAG TPA: type II toxin-antitoxin system prevent-host-death family antitoxin [Candidatus Kryptonia bacterium]|nr:type II toxin-antitoxin system prevent-host-death family antitoxin [Candidatus Kryptonia bacterium]